MKYAIMFADIVGSTQLFEKLGDAAAADCVNQCVAQMADITRQYGGEVINTIGDEIMSRFTTADDAIRAAIHINEWFSTQPVGKPHTVVAMRIGIHFGEIVRRADDIFGDVVNVASRLANIATANQIIISQAVVDNLSTEFNQKVREFDKIEVKGKQEKFTLFEVLWGETDITLMHGTLTNLTQNQCLHLIYQNQSNTLQAIAATFVLGRSADSDLIIEAALVSRIHAHCVYRRGKFILIDRSTNGTFVKTQEGKEVYLRREEIPLIGRGIIGLGESTRNDNGQLIQYICV